MLITHAVSITMPQIAFDLQMAGMTCTHCYGGTSAESRAQTSRWIGSLRLSCLLIRLRSIWSLGGGGGRRRGRGGWARQSALIPPISHASAVLVNAPPPPPAAEKHDLVERIESRRTLPMHSGWAMTSTI